MTEQEHALLRSLINKASKGICFNLLFPFNGCRLDVLFPISLSCYFYPHVWTLHLFSSTQAFGVLPSVVKEQRVLHILYLATVDSSQIFLILKHEYFDPRPTTGCLKITLVRWKASEHCYYYKKLISLLTCSGYEDV